MSFSFVERFKSQANVLSEAAKQFQSFDDMAAQDDYIHSDSLNVKNTSSSSTTNKQDSGRRTRDVLNSLIMTPQEVCFDESESIASSSNMSEPHHRRPSHDSNLTSTNSSTIIEDSLRDFHDPILDMARSNNNKENSESRSLKKKTSTVAPQDTARKSANRFMDDLNDRLSKPIEDRDVEMGQPSSEVQPSAEDKWEWIKSAAKSRVQDFMVQNATSSTNEEQVPFRSPLSRSFTTKPKSSAVQQEQDDFHVVQSTSILHADDVAELDRIRQGDSLSFVLTVVKQNPQLAFIAFTLVLGSAIYFYSRHLTADDVS